MPDEHGKLTEQEIDTAIRWLREKASEECSSCGEKSWTVAQHVVVLRAETQSILAEHTYYPALLAICKHCARFQLHGAIRAGIEPFRADAEKEADNV